MLIRDPQSFYFIAKHHVQIKSKKKEAAFVMTAS